MLPIHCPECASVMRVIVDKEVEIDSCERCSCIWLDAGELEKLSTALNATRDFSPSNGDSENPHSCPRCDQQRLVGLTNTVGNIETCRSCNGILIPGATLERFLNQMAANQSTTVTTSAGYLAIMPQFDVASAAEILFWILHGLGSG